MLLQGLQSDEAAKKEFSDNDDPISVAIRGKSATALRWYLFAPSSSQIARETLRKTTSAGWGYIHLVASLGLSDFIPLLVEAGLSPNSMGGPQRHTPLHEAARNCHEDCARALLRNGAEVDGCAFQPLGPDYTPLSLAVQFSDSKGSALTVCETLLEHGARFQGRVYDESVAHRSLASPPLLRALLGRWPELAHVRNSEHATPLEDCAPTLNADAARILVEYGADVNVRDAHNATPLHMLFALVQGLADLAFFRQFSRNAGFDYSIERHRQMIQLLLDSGADVDAESDAPADAEYPGQSLTPESAIWNDALYSSEQDIVVEDACLVPSAAWSIQKRCVNFSAYRRCV